MQSRILYIFSGVCLLYCKVHGADGNSTDVNKETLLSLEFPGKENDTELVEIDFEDNGRDKRALGIFLQGLVQALGYNTTPIQIASLPNSGGMQFGPITLDLGNDQRVVNSGSGSAPTGSVTTTPRQRETLRFTGVVNFGNNTNISDHLRQYERIFHGRPTAVPSVPPVLSSTVAPSATPTPPVSPASPIPLLQPFFVPIPIPLAENLRYPKPLISVVTTPLPVSNNVGNDGQVNSDLDERAPEPRPRPGLEPKPRPRPGLGSGPRPESVVKPKPASLEQSDERGNDQDELSNSEESKEQKDENYQENEYEENDASEGSDRNRGIENERREEIMAKLKESLGSPEEYVSKMIPKYSEGFGLKLPIEIKPFRGQLMNSYGQSLEHDGRIDDNVADFFAKFRNPKTGVFEPLKIDDSEDQKGKFEDNGSDSVEKLPQKYLNKQHKFEYDMKNEDRDEEIQNVANEDLTDAEESDDEDEEDYEEEVDDQEEEVEDEENLPAEKIRNSENKDSAESQPSVQNDPRYNERLQNPPGNNVRLQNMPYVEQPFNFANYNPYYKPVQYFYPPDSLERTAQRISSYQNLDNFATVNQGYPPSDESFVRTNPDYVPLPRIAKRIAPRQQSSVTDQRHQERPSVPTTMTSARNSRRREEPVAKSTSQSARKLEEKLTVSRTSTPARRRDNLTMHSSPVSTSATPRRINSTSTSTSTSTTTTTPLSNSIPPRDHDRQKSENRKRKPENRGRIVYKTNANRNFRIVNNDNNNDDNDKNNQDIGQVATAESMKRNIDSARSARSRSRNN